MHAVAAERVQIDGHGGNQGLALAGLHFRDHAPVQHDAAQQLDVERAFPQRALGDLANGGEGVNHQAVEVFAVGQALFQPGGAGGEILVAQGLH